MHSFTVRVELTPSAGANYALLHTAMERNNFRRTITADDGRVYRMPEAEYDIIGNFDRTQVLNMAAAAMQSINLTGHILVTQSAGRTWRLPPAA